MGDLFELGLVHGIVEIEETWVFLNLSLLGSEQRDQLFEGVAFGFVDLVYDLDGRFGLIHVLRLNFFALLFSEKFEKIMLVFFWFDLFALSLIFFLLVFFFLVFIRESTSLVGVDFIGMVVVLAFFVRFLEFLVAFSELQIVLIFWDFLLLVGDVELFQILLNFLG